MAHTRLHLRVMTVVLALFVLSPIGARTTALGQTRDNLRQMQQRRVDRRSAAERAPINQTDDSRERAWTNQTDDSRAQQGNEPVIPWTEIQAQLRSEVWDTQLKAIEYVRSHRIAEAVPELSDLLFKQEASRLGKYVLPALAAIGNAESSEALCRACIDLPDEDLASDAARLMPTETIEANLTRLMAAAFDESKKPTSGASTAPGGTARMTDVIRSFQPQSQGGAPGVVVALWRIQSQELFSSLGDRMNAGNLATQLTCIKILAGNDGPECIKLLADYCVADNLPSEVRLAAVEGLQGWVDSLSKIPQRQLAAVTSSLKAALGGAAASADVGVKMAALRGMVSVSPPDSIALARELFTSDDPAVRRECINHLSRGAGDRVSNSPQGNAAASEYRVMRPFLDFAFEGLADNSPDVRAAVADRIGYLTAMTGAPCIEDARLATRLAECLSNEQDIQVRLCLVGSLGVYALTACAQRELIKALESDPEASVRAKAAQTLGAWHTTERSGPAVGYTTTYPWVNSEKHLGYMQAYVTVPVRDSDGRHYSSASVRTIVVALTKALKDSAPGVVSEARDSLRSLGAEK